MADPITPAGGTAYESFGTLAVSMIKKFGSAATLVRTPPAGKYDPKLGRAPSGSIETYQTIAVASSWTFSRRPTLADNTASQRVLVAAQGLAIQPNPEMDTLTWNGASMRIVSLIVTAPGGVPILYDMECVGIGASAYLPEEIAPFEARVLDRQRNIIVTRDGTDPSVR